MSPIPRTKRHARLLGYAATGSPEWFQMRSGAMTGSRIAAALGLSPFMSPFSLYFVMTGLMAEQQLTSGPIEWGVRLESAVVQKWADEHPWLRVKTRPTVWQNIERPWQVCSPDALVIEPGPSRFRRPRGVSAILEVKTSRYDDLWGKAGTDEIPVHYRCQALWMLDTLGLRFCHFGALFSGSDYREYVVEYDQADVDILRRGAVDFLGRVARGERPDIDGADSTYEVIKAFHPDITNEAVELPDDMVKAQKIAQEEYREAQNELLTVRSSIAEFMGNARTARAPRQPNEAVGRKVADRRSKMGGTPYVQCVDITDQPTISERQAS